jgi:hypothetical protein
VVPDPHRNGQCLDCSRAHSRTYCREYRRLAKLDEIDERNKIQQEVV